MGGHGHGHGDPYAIPDYKIYKVENIPELLRTKKALEAQGLRDPWLRNEVWRYDIQQFGSASQRIRLVFFRGFKFGFAAFVGTMAATYAYDAAFPSKHGHGEHH